MCRYVISSFNVFISISPQWIFLWQAAHSWAMVCKEGGAIRLWQPQVLSCYLYLYSYLYIHVFVFSFVFNNFKPKRLWEFLFPCPFLQVQPNPCGFFPPAWEVVTISKRRRKSRWKGSIQYIEHWSTPSLTLTSLWGLGKKTHCSSLRPSSVFWTKFVSTRVRWAMWTWKVERLEWKSKLWLNSVLVGVDSWHRTVASVGVKEIWSGWKHQDVLAFHY